MHHLDEIEDQLVEFELGRQLLKVVYPVAEEVIDLINYEREVTVTWHRNQGPAFFGYIIKSAFDQEVVIPREIAGVKLTTLLRRLASIMQHYGSLELQNTISEHLVLILKTAEKMHNTKKLLNELRLAS